MIAPYRFLNELIYCLESGFPAPVTEVMLALAGDSYSQPKLLVAHKVWQAVGPSAEFDFIEVVEAITDRICYFCDDCNTYVWDVCECDGQYVCNDCLHNYYRCDCCESFTRETTYVSGRSLCESCVDHYCTWCDRCDAYFYNDDEDHQHSCECEAPHLRFEFPNDGHGTVSQDERVIVELPKGTIDEAGISLIACLVQNAIMDSSPDPYFSVWFDLDEIGTLWQTKQGNFTRRLSSVLYKKHKFKVPAGIISEVGNLARAHSSDSSEWNVEFTRNLNLPAEEFYHGSSCWFSDGSYGASRCALKQWGGLALRTYDDYNNLTGRAWVQPLNADLEPTHDAINAHAYIVYNGYGDLGGYVAARIVAHLTSRTYRKVEFSAEPQFINGDSGYLIADEATCLDTERVGYEHDEHFTTDANQIKVKVYA